MWETFKSLVDGLKITTLVVLVILDFVLGIVVAAKKGKFSLAYFSNYLKTSVLYMVGGYFTVGLLATVDTTFVPAVTAAWIGLDAALIGMITAKLSDLGVPMPQVLKKPIDT